jgi:hypothetical protein
MIPVLDLIPSAFIPVTFWPSVAGFPSGPNVFGDLSALAFGLTSSKTDGFPFCAAGVLGAFGTAVLVLMPDIPSYADYAESTADHNREHRPAQLHNPHPLQGINGCTFHIRLL